MFDSLSNIEGIEVWSSEANFILFRVMKKESGFVHTELLKNKILIKNLHGSHPLLENCLRVTVGTKDENETFLSTLKKILR